MGTRLYAEKNHGKIFCALNGITWTPKWQEEMAVKTAIYEEASEVFSHTQQEKSEWEKFKATFGENNTVHEYVNFLTFGFGKFDLSILTEEKGRWKGEIFAGSTEDLSLCWDLLVDATSRNWSGREIDLKTIFEAISPDPAWGEDDTPGLGWN